VSKLKARIEKLEAEIKALKQQVAKLTGQPANQKKTPTGADVVIEIANEDDVTIGEKKHTLSSLRKLLADSPPSRKRPSSGKRNARAGWRYESSWRSNSSERCGLRGMADDAQFHPNRRLS